MSERVRSYSAYEVAEQDRLDAIERAYKEELNYTMWQIDVLLVFEREHGWDIGKTEKWMEQSTEALGRDKMISIVNEKLGREQSDAPVLRSDEQMANDAQKMKQVEDDLSFLQHPANLGIDLTD